MDKAPALLTDPEHVAYHGPIAEAYRREKRRVRELGLRLSEIDPEWIAAWKARERGAQ